MPPRFATPPAWTRELRYAGVTGTNGKTSTVFFLAAILRDDPTGEFSASKNPPKPVAQSTTLGLYLDAVPQSDLPRSMTGFLKCLQRARDAGGQFAVLEVTSEVLALGFAQAWPVEVAVFTNLSHDHLDAHESPEHYFAAKAQMFVHLAPGSTAVLNDGDDVSAILREVIPKGVHVVSYVGATATPEVNTAAMDTRTAESDAESTTTPANQLAAAAAPDLRLQNVHASLDGTRAELVDASGNITPLEVRAVGDIYAENATAALLAAEALGVDRGAALARLSRAAPPTGRFEVVHRSPGVVIDYAHTPDALRRSLAVARQVTRGRVCVVFGAGGHRDVAKRPLMGQAANAADHVILTTDNPRDEDPGAIAEAIRQGLNGASSQTILNRLDAIREGLKWCARDDLLLVAGKGHEGRTERHATAASLSSDELSDHQLVERALS